MYVRIVERHERQHTLRLGEPMMNFTNLHDDSSLAE